jgi:hypothetical protein
VRMWMTRRSMIIVSYVGSMVVFLTASMVYAQCEGWGVVVGLMSPGFPIVLCRGVARIVATVLVLLIVATMVQSTRSSRRLLWLSCGHAALLVYWCWCFWLLEAMLHATYG